MAHYDKVIVKKPKDDQELTKEEAKEWIKCANDFFYFAENYCYTQSTWYGGRTVFNPTDPQKRLLTSCINNQYSLGLFPRQRGKTTAVAVFFLWLATFHQDETLGVVSKSLSNVKDVVARIKFAYENLPFFLKPACVEYSVFTIGFDNGSSIRGETMTPGAMRGLSLTGLFIDEIAFGSPKVVSEMMRSIFPIITQSGGRMIITSTPSGTGDYFSSLYFAAKNGESNFHLTEFYEHEYPDYNNPEFKKNALKEMSLNEYLQEYRCHFISDKGTLVNSVTIESIKTYEPVEEIEEIDFYITDLTNRVLSVSVDVSEGVGQDSHGIQVLDLESFEQVAEFENNILNQTEFTKKFLRLIEILWEKGAKEIYYGIENNGVSRGVITLILNTESKALNKCTPVSIGKGFGVTTTNKTKMEGCMKLKDLLETHKLTLYSEKLINELRFFIKKGKSFAAEAGMTDDLVMALVISMNMLDQLKYQEDSVYEQTALIDSVNNNEGEESDPMPIIF